MKRFLFSIMVGLALVCTAQEQESTPSASRLDDYMSPGMEVSGIRAPYYDDDGKLQVQLYGGYAKVMDGGAAEITNLRIDVYQDDKVAMTIFAPSCISQAGESSTAPGKKILSVSSDGAVLIELDELSISGRGFRFSSENNRFEIYHDSKVLVKESARNRKGVDL